MNLQIKNNKHSNQPMTDHRKLKASQFLIPSISTPPSIMLETRRVSIRPMTSTLTLVISALKTVRRIWTIWSWAVIHQARLQSRITTLKHSIATSIIMLKRHRIFTLSLVQIIRINSNFHSSKTKEVWAAQVRLKETRLRSFRVDQIVIILLSRGQALNLWAISRQGDSMISQFIKRWVRGQMIWALRMIKCSVKMRHLTQCSRVWKHNRRKRPWNE